MSRILPAWGRHAGTPAPYGPHCALPRRLAALRTVVLLLALLAPELSLEAVAAFPPAATTEGCATCGDMTAEHGPDDAAAALLPSIRPARYPTAALRPASPSIAGTPHRAAPYASPPSHAHVPRAPGVLRSVVLRC